MTKEQFNKDLHAWFKEYRVLVKKHSRKILKLNGEDYNKQRIINLKYLLDVSNLQMRYLNLFTTKIPKE